MNNLRYAIEIVNQINDTIKCAFIDHQMGAKGYSSQSLVACRQFDVLPTLINEQDKAFILDRIKNSNYRILPDGSRLLPEVISSLGGLTLPARQVDFIVRVYDVTSIKGNLRTVNFLLLEEFHVKGIEGKGNGFRHLTNYSITYIQKPVLKVA